MPDFPAFAHNRIPWQVKNPERFLAHEKKLRDLGDRLLSRIPQNTPSLSQKVKAQRRMWRGQLSGEVLAEEEQREKTLSHFLHWADKKEEFLLEDLPVVHSQAIGTKQPSSFRREPATLYSKGEFFDDCPLPEDLSDLFEELLLWSHLKEDIRFPFMKCFLVHLLLASIHFFPDANGRVARAYEYNWLRQKGLALGQDWHPELLTHWNPEQYALAMRTSRFEGIADTFISFSYSGYLNLGRSLQIS